MYMLGISRFQSTCKAILQLYSSAIGQDLNNIQVLQRREAKSGDLDALSALERVWKNAQLYPITIDPPKR